MIVVLLFNFFSPWAKADLNKDLFTQSTANLAKGKYSTALTGYQQLELAGELTANVYSNMGYCYFKMGQSGRSVLYFQKALLLAPLDTQIVYNKNRVYAHLGPTVMTNNSGYDMEKESFFKIMDLLNKTCVLITIVTIFSISAMFIDITKKYKLIIRRVCFCLLALMLLITVTAFIVFRVHQSKVYAVVTRPVSAVRLGPSVLSKTTGNLLEGYEIMVINTYENWSEIKDYNGNSGWIESGAIAEVR